MSPALNVYGQTHLSQSEERTRIKKLYAVMLKLNKTLRLKFNYNLFSHAPTSCALNLLKTLDILELKCHYELSICQIYIGGFSLVIKRFAARLRKLNM